MKHIILLLSLLALCLAGCGNNVRVSGKVTFEDDNSPLPKGSVIFQTDTNRFSGFIRNGTYSAGETKAGQGIPPGTYKVWLSGTERLENVYNSKGVPTADGVVFPQITSEYSSANKTPLTLEVKPGKSITYDITVKRHPEWNKQQKYKPK